MNETVEILFVSCVAILSLGLVVIFRNPAQVTSRLLLVICTGLASWMVCNYLTEYSFAAIAFNDLFSRLSYFTGGVAVMAITLFCYSLERAKTPRMPIWFWVMASASLGLSLTTLVAGTVARSDGELAFTVGPLLPVYGIFLLACVGLWSSKLFSIARHSKGYVHAQAKIILFGVSLSVLGAIATNVILPVVNNNYSTSNLGPIFPVFIAYTIGYAVIRYRLFDVRLAITRVIGYAITILMVAIMYSALFVTFSAKLLDLEDLSLAKITLLTLPTIFVALTFNRLANFVARFTQHIFYQDAYDIRDVLDKLSDALLTDNNIDEIMDRSLGVLIEAIKPESAYLAVLNSSGAVYKQMQKGDNHALKDIAPLITRLRKEKVDLIDREEVAGRPIAKLMGAQNQDLLLRLGSKEAPIGVLLLGPKQSGSMYKKQDVSLLRISAKNLGIALDNARKYEQIIHFADTLHKEVNRATTRLRKANEELKTLDALKDDFISTASHQLRSPAVSVHDALHMLNYPNVSKKDREELLVLAEGSSERLVTVVRTLLNMARLQAGHFTIDTSEADFVDIIDRELDQVKVLAAQKSITIDFDKPAQPIKCHVDVAKISEAIANYVENAIKYSLEKTTITLVVSEEHHKIRFEVYDQGMGVPPAERKDLFGRFYRATNARQEQPDGNGIGLYVVRNIAEGHGGEAYYKPGKERGSVFGFIINADTAVTAK